MPSTTAAGTGLAISAGIPASQSAGGYAALSYTEVGNVEQLGGFGPTTEVTSFQPLKGAQQKHKGPTNFGALNPTIALDDADAGQALLAAAAAPDNRALYAVRVTKPDGSLRYFQVRVFGMPETIGAANSMITAAPVLEINTPVIKVAAGAPPAPVFTTAPSISPTSGAVGTTFTANDGAASNATGYTRRWLLGTTAIGTGTTVTPNAAGNLTLEVTATGAGGSTPATSSVVTVTATPTPTPAPLSGDIYYMGDSRVRSFYNDSAFNNKNAGNHLVVANTQMGQRMNTIGNGAAAGLRSNEYNSATPTMTASSAGTLVIFGVVNDISQGRTGADSWATVKDIADAAIAAGKSVVLHTEPGAEGFNSTQIGHRNTFNSSALAYQAANPTKVRIFDFAASALVDPTSTTSIAFKTGYSYDGTHLSNLGARAVGTDFAAWAATHIGGTPLNMTALQTSNLLQNPLFATTTGGTLGAGTTGTVPANWSSSRSATAAATISTGVSPDGGNEVIVAATGSAAGDRVNLRQSVATGLAMNDKVRLAVRLAVDAGAVNLRSVRVWISAWFDGATVNIEKYDMQPIPAPGNTSSGAYIDFQAPEVITLTRSGSTTFDRVDVTIAAEFSGSGSATFRVRQTALNKA